MQFSLLIQVGSPESDLDWPIGEATAHWKWTSICSVMKFHHTLSADQKKLSMINGVIPTIRTKKLESKKKSDHRVFFTWRSCMSLVLLRRRKPIGSLLPGQYTPYDSYHTSLISLFCMIYTAVFWPNNKLLLLIWLISECTCLKLMSFI